MRQNTIKKTKKCYEEMHVRTIKIFLKKNKTRKGQYVCNQYRRLFIENELSEEKNEKRQYTGNLYNKPSKEKKAKCVNVRVDSVEIFPKKKKTKSVNIQANDIYFFLKSYNFLWKYKQVFPSKKFGFFGQTEKRSFYNNKEYV